MSYQPKPIGWATTIKSVTAMPREMWENWNEYGR